MRRDWLGFALLLIIGWGTLGRAATYIPEKEREIVEKLADYADKYLLSYGYVMDKSGDLLYEAGNSTFWYGSDDIPETYFAGGPNIKIGPNSHYPGIGIRYDQRQYLPPQEQARAELEAFIGAKLNEGTDQWRLGLQALEQYIKKYPKETVWAELPGKIRLSVNADLPNGSITRFIGAYSETEYRNRTAFRLLHKWPKVTPHQIHEAEVERQLNFAKLEALFAQEHPRSVVKRSLGNDPYFKQLSLRRRK